MKKKIKENQVTWGIIGAGDVCEKKSAPAMKKIPGSNIRAIMRRNLEKAKDYAYRHQIPHWYTDAAQIINDPQINAIYIATPPESHAELAIAAARAGKPVYVEKPMARTYDECTVMVQAFEKADIPLYVAYYRRALPNFLKVKELVESGVIGEIRMVTIEMYKPLESNEALKDDPWRLDPNIAGGGHFYDLASHQLDILDYIIAPITQATGYSTNQAGRYKADDIVTSSFVFENGVLGSGSWCFTTGQAAEKEITTIIGTAGTINFATFGSEVTVESDSTGRKVFDFEMPEHIQQPLIEQIIGDLLGKNLSPSTGVSGARTNDIMEKMCQPV
ncbi:MAG: Gfo/Idh/MocA family oxidoreductase [Balneolales bacterium]